MTTEHTEVQIIRQGGRPAFAVVPYSDWLELIGQEDKEALIPHEVVGLMVERGLSPLAAWRKYKKLSQIDVAAKLGVSQAAITQMEKPDSKPQAKTLERYAEALGIEVAQLSV